MRLHVAHRFLPKTPSVRAARVMDYFGIGFEQGEHVVADGLELPIGPGDVVLFTGASGSGKSSLMRACAVELAQGANVVSLEDVEIRRTLGEQRVLVELLPPPVEEALSLLSACGLGEAQLMLRTPAELSDGQRYRFSLALGLARRPDWLVADEFTATLDRTLAKVVAFNLRRLADRAGCGVLLATTHADVADDLAPDVHVRCRLDGLSPEVVLREGVNGGETMTRARTSATGVNENCIRNGTSVSRPNCGSAPRPAATGRTSLGGITAATTSASSGS